MFSLNNFIAKSCWLCGYSTSKERRVLVNGRRALLLVLHIFSLQWLYWLLTKRTWKLVWTKRTAASIIAHRCSLTIKDFLPREYKIMYWFAFVIIFMLDNNAKFPFSGPASKIVIKFFLAIWCGLLGSLFTFPGLRMAKMHWDTLKWVSSFK